DNTRIAPPGVEPQNVRLHSRLRDAADASVGLALLMCMLDVRVAHRNHELPGGDKALRERVRERLRPLLRTGRAERSVRHQHPIVFVAGDQVVTDRTKKATTMAARITVATEYGILRQIGSAIEYVDLKRLGLRCDVAAGQRPTRDR